ncbi:MAG: tetratricopeptide repeat protein [Bacteroidota bacterium]
MKNRLLYLLFLTFLFLFSFPSFSQQNKIDSLLKLLDTAKEDTNKVNILNDLCSAYQNSDPEKAKKYGKLALSQAEMLEYKKGIARSYDNMGNIHKNQGNYDKALEYYLKSLKIMEEANDKRGRTNSLGNIGVIYYYQKNYDKALDYFIQTLNYYKEMNDKGGLGRSLDLIGVIYKHNGEYNKAIKYHRQSLEIREEINDKVGIASCFENIAIAYAMQDEYKEAIENFKNSLSLSKKSGNKLLMAKTLGNIGELYSNWAEYLQQLDPSNLFIQESLKSAVEYLQNSLEMAREIDAKNEIKFAYQNIAEVYSKQKDFKKAFENYKMYAGIKDTIYSEESSGKIAEMQTKYESDKKEKENELLRKDKVIQDSDIKRQRIIIVSAIIAFILAIALSMLYFNRYKLKKKTGLQLERKNASIMRQKEEIEKINVELEKLSIVASETDNSIFIMDAQGNLEWANEGFTRLSGYSLEEFIDEKGKNLVEISGNSEIGSLLDECIKKRQAVVFESINRAKDGTEYWAHTMITPIIGKGGKINKLVAIDSDITAQKKAEEEIREKNREITDSIRYAQNIQSAILPTDEQIQELLPNSFVLLKPHSIVSGDFYWMTERDGKVFFCAADSTGHGVPGALMSMIISSLLNEVVIEKGIMKPNEIFHEVRKGIIKSLKQTEEGQKDGMDAVLCLWDKKNNTLEFAVANNPLYLIRGWELHETERDKQPVGYLTGEHKPFTHHEIKLQKNDTIYIFSDGFQDQFGGPRDKKFGRKQFKEVLLSIQPKSMEEQKEALDKAIEDWKGDSEQIDDILVIGVRF